MPEENFSWFWVQLVNGRWVPLKKDRSGWYDPLRLECIPSSDIEFVGPKIKLPPEVLMRE